MTRYQSNVKKILKNSYLKKYRYNSFTHSSYSSVTHNSDNRIKNKLSFKKLKIYVYFRYENHDIKDHKMLKRFNFLFILIILFKLCDILPGVHSGGNIISS